MKPLRIRVDRLIDFGTIVSMVGIDADTGKPVAACAEVRDEGGSTATDPAVRLMVTQLAWVCRANCSIDDYGHLLAECRRRVAGETGR